jgi:hypothetical protein
VIRIALVFAVAALGACAKQATEEARPAPMSAEEIKRAEDACKTYVEKVCACSDKVPAAKDECGLARALPDAVQLQLSLAGAPETKKNDVLAAQAGVRKVVKQCIEAMAKLPALGCQ